MKYSASIAAIIAATLCSGVALAANKTFIAGGGSDTGSCPSSAPCATLNYAFTQTAARGEIVCLNSGGFGNLTITRSVTIDCLGTSSTPGNGGNTSYIDVSVGTTDRVILRGLNITGTDTAASFFSGGGTLVLDHVKMGGNFFDGKGALIFQPTSAARLVVSDSIFTTGGGNSSGAGIRIVPSPGGTAQVMLDRVTVAANAFGVAVDGSLSTGGINLTIKDSTMSGNAQDGIVATTSAGGAPISVTIVNSASTNNAYGIRSIGSNVTVRVEGSKIIGNGIGLSGGGALLSGGGNTVQANATNGGFTGSYALQ